MSPHQLIRDVTALLVLAVSVVAYHLVLRRYLADLERPMLFEIGFLMSFGIALMYELRGGYRQVVAGSTCTALVFVSGALAAIWCRDFYELMVDQIRDVPEVVEFLGQDIASALTNRAVGYGGAFAIGLLLGRLTVGSRIVRGWLMRCLLGPPGDRPICPHCNNEFGGIRFAISKYRKQSR